MFFCHGILKNGKDEILILKRAKKDLYPNLWDLPGGFKENGETFEQCVIREFKEETNLNIKIKKLYKIKKQIYNNKIIIVLIYIVECNSIENIKLDSSHIEYKFSNKIDKKNCIWYLKKIDNQYRLSNKNGKHINYLFSGINYETGFNKKQTLYLKKDISNNSVITFIPTTLDDYKKNDNLVEKTLKNFKNIKINFSEIYLIDNRISKNEKKKYIENSNIVYLLGGNPENQMNLIKKFKLSDLIKNRNGITIGVSAGSMNQAEHVVYKDQNQNNRIIDYVGIGLTDIYVYPHFDITNVEYLSEILEISEYVKIYTLPNDSFIRIQNENLKFIGDYYVIED